MTNAESTLQMYLTSNHLRTELKACVELNGELYHLSEPANTYVLNLLAMLKGSSGSLKNIGLISSSPSVRSVSGPSPDKGLLPKRRGAITSSPYGKVLPTYHPAFLFKDNMHLRPIVVFDLMKAKRQAEFPEIRRPERTVYVPENLDDITRCIERMGSAEYLSVDIETAGDQITCIGFAWSSKETLVIPIFDNRETSRSYWPLEIEKEVWQRIREICHLPMKKLFQNGLYDLRFLWQQYGIAVAKT
jgi:hypothetical protein